MHGSVMTFVAKAVDGRRFGKVLEVGSMDVNGSVRGLLDTVEYVGVDMLEGRGVDLVANAHELPFPDDEFDCVISTEMLEHDDQPWTSMTEMTRVLKPRHLLIVTARGYDERGCFPLHSFPDDLWRYSTGGVVALAKWAGLEIAQVMKDPEDPGVFLLAKKPEEAEEN